MKINPTCVGHLVLLFNLFRRRPVVFCGRPVAYMAAKRMAHRPHELATAERKAVEIRFSQL